MNGLLPPLLPHTRDPPMLCSMVLKLETNLWNDGTVRGQDYQLACGKNHSAIMQTGKLFTYGSNEFGQCGVSRALTMGVVPHEDTPKAVGTVLNAVFVACGEEHTAVVTEAGALYMVGQGGMGQLGLSTFTDPKQLGASPPPPECRLR